MVFFTLQLQLPGTVNIINYTGDKPRKNNPTNYREPGLYEAIFNSVTQPTDEEGVVYGFDLVFRKPLTSYVKVSLVFRKPLTST